MSLVLDIEGSVAAPNYEALITLVGDYLNRSDLNARIPTFIELAIRRFNRNLWTPEREVTLTVAASGNYALPTDFYQLRSAFITADDDIPLEQVSFDQLKGFANFSSIPAHFAIQGGVMYFDPQPDGPYNLTINYYASIAQLSDAKPSNWLLEKHPDVLLYGSLVQAEAFLGDDNRIPLWKAALDEGLGEIMRVGIRQRVSAGPIKMRANTVV